MTSGQNLLPLKMTNFVLNRKQSLVRAMTN